jgi:hypothetical protein
VGRALAGILATAFFLGFGGFFVFGGFQTVGIDLARDVSGRVDGTLVRSHLGGLYTVRALLRGVTAVVIETRRTGGGSGRSFLSAGLTSGLLIRAESGDTPLFAGYSNVDEAYRRQIARKLNAFIRRGEAARFSEQFRISNVFGWIGLPFFLFGLVGVIGWPLTLLARSRRARR